MRGRVPPGMRLIALDVGKKTIGVAVCDDRWRVATPCTTIARRKFAGDMEALFALMEREGGIGGVIIGWPLNMDGSAGRRCDSVRDFTHAMLRAREVAGLADLPHAFHDERLSSASAEDAMIEAGLPPAKRAANRDALAAARILEGFLARVE